MHPACAYLGGNDLNTNDPRFDIIRRHRDGEATPDERAQLESCLRTDPALRAAYVRYMNLDVALGAAAKTNSPPVKVKVGFRSRWLQWRPLTAAAAGLMIGFLSAAVVFGFVTQQGRSVQSLVTEGFEDVEMLRFPGLPSRAEVWAGNFEAPQGAEGDVKPAEGQRMVTLPPVEKQKFSYAFRFVDLAALPPLRVGQTRELEVSAQFQGSAPGVSDRCQIRLVAFAEDVAGAREIWKKDRLNQQALLHVAKTVGLTPDEAGWTTLRSSIAVPAGARLVLVALAAGVVDDAAPKTAHYLDDVEIRLITLEAHPSSRHPFP